ncbi:MAG: hypothetical protein KA368_18445 [Acidobacteria bacterium]|nr:hypothetical protein [Acidobacteriota bacterium]
MNNQQTENISLNNEIADLEPNNAEEINGGQTREHILLARQTSTGGSSTRGDANGDGTVTSSDFVIWR